MYHSAFAAITKDYRLGCLLISFLHWRVETQDQDSGQFSSCAISLSGLEITNFCMHLASFCILEERE